MADVPSRTLAELEVPRLMELRLEAAEARADAELHLGRHGAAVGELQALVAAEPLRERLWELLMLALYRSGQQAAALAAYLEARRRLVDQIGIEPGPGLREMNQKILLSDPALRLLAPSEALPGTRAQARPEGPRPAKGRGGTRDKTRPDLLPSAVPDFTGRAAELAELSALRGQPAAIGYLMVRE